MANVLNIRFEQASGAEHTLKITQPKENLDSAAVRTQALAIIAANVFDPNGSALKIYKGAEMVETEIVKYLA